MVGIGNYIAMLGMARLGARRGTPTVAIHVININQESHVRWDLKNVYARYQRQDLPLGPSDISFQGRILLK
jgi:hypothetical protein